MGAGQHSLRPLSGNARSRLPNGDALHSSVEDAPRNRVSEDSYNGSISAEPRRSRVEAHPKVVRRFESIFLPFRRIVEGSGDRDSEESNAQGDISGRSQSNSDGRCSENRPQRETGSRLSNPDEASRHDSSGEVGAARRIPVREGEEEGSARFCFLDQSRVCDSSCTAYLETRKNDHLPCIILKYMVKGQPVRVSNPPPFEPPPKVNI